MSRVTPNEDGENWDYIRWAGAEKKTFNGKPGQAILKEIEQALLSMPEKRLIQDEWVTEDDVCILGSLHVFRKVKEENISWENARHAISEENIVGFESSDIAQRILHLTRTMAWTIIYENDEWTVGTPEQRYDNMLRYVRSRINY